MIRFFSFDIRKDYFEIPWAELRSMVEPSFSERMLIKHTDYLTNARIITSSAVNITESQVLTADGGSVTFDYLVIGTGHAYSTPRSRDDRFQQFEQCKLFDILFFTVSSSVVTS